MESEMFNKSKIIPEIGFVIISILALTACGSTDQDEGSAAPSEPLASGEELQEQPVTPEQGPVDPTRFLIVADETEARFVINEVLRGNPKTVVGINNEVSGEIIFDIQDPSASEIGEIRIAAGSFATDNSFRNGAIKRFILQSDEFEFIVFTPISIEGLPESVSREEAVILTVTGELTIRDITRTVQFQTDVKTISNTRLEGFATVMIKRSDFDLTIPEVPQVAGVDDDFILEFEFVAEAR